MLMIKKYISNIKNVNDLSKLVQELINLRTLKQIIIKIIFTVLNKQKLW